MVSTPKVAVTVAVSWPGLSRRPEIQPLPVLLLELVDSAPWEPAETGAGYSWMTVRSLLVCRGARIGLSRDCSGCARSARARQSIASTPGAAFRCKGQ